MKFAAPDIRAALDERPPLPTDVSDWHVETGMDSADEPAVWIWAVLPEEMANFEAADFDALIAVRDLVLEHVRKESEIPLGVYVSFRTVGEMVELK